MIANVQKFINCVSHSHWFNRINNISWKVKEEGKVVPVFIYLIKHNAMKMYVGARVLLHLFLTLEWSASRTGLFTP
jgi:hypothetical protein